MSAGRFITVEGIEGVGKTTNIAFIRSLIEGHGASCVVTREPGGTPYAEKIRSLLLSPSEEPVSETSELLLMFAARAQHIDQVILPSLEKGVWVVSDRFTDATYAYQGGGRGLPEQDIAVLETLVQKGLQPDLTILLDAPVETGLSRARNRSLPDRFEREQFEFFLRVRNKYLQRAEAFPDRIKVINASAPLESVQAQIKTAVLSYFAQSAEVKIPGVAD